MAAKRFHVADPEQLHELEAFVKDGNLKTMVSVWRTTKRRDGKTRWDDRIYVGFSGDRKRIAEVMRIDTNDELLSCASLHYNQALNWCEQHLKPVYD